MAQEELIRNTAITVGTDVTVISEEQYGAQRTVIFLTNTSTGGQVITITPAAEATAGIGVVLSPGGFYQDTIDSGYTPTNTRITAVSSLAGGTIAVHERIKMKTGFN